MRRTDKLRDTQNLCPFDGRRYHTSVVSLVVFICHFYGIVLINDMNE